jgi:exonuclease SbcD
MGFGFDEAEETRSLTLVDLEAEGVAGIRQVPLVSPRPLRVLSGTLSELLSAGRSPGAPATDALIKAVLTDEGALVDAIGQLRAVYPHVLQLERAARSIAAGPGGVASRVDRRDPTRLVGSFLEAVRGDGPSPEEADVIGNTLALVERGEEA